MNRDRAPVVWQPLSDFDALAASVSEENSEREGSEFGVSTDDDLQDWNTRMLSCFSRKEARELLS